MNKNDILCLFHSPYSAWGLRHRATKIPEGNPYRNLLELLAELLDKKKINQHEAKVIIETARQGRWKDVIWTLQAEYSLQELEAKLLAHEKERRT